MHYMEVPSGYLCQVHRLDFEKKGVFLQDDARFDCKLVASLEELVV